MENWLYPVYVDVITYSGLTPNVVFPSLLIKGSKVVARCQVVNVLNCMSKYSFCIKVHSSYSLIARFMGPTWGPSGADRTQVGPMLTPWTLLSGLFYHYVIIFTCPRWPLFGNTKSEWLNFMAFLGTADSEVHIVHISRVITAYTLESSSSLT